MKIRGILVSLMGIGLSAFLFLMDYLNCDSDMNPLCFIWCIWPVVVFLPLATVIDDLD